MDRWWNVGLNIGRAVAFKKWELIKLSFGYFGWQHANNVRRTAMAYAEKLEQRGRRRRRFSAHWDIPDRDILYKPEVSVVRRLISRLFVSFSRQLRHLWPKLTFQGRVHFIDINFNVYERNSNVWIYMDSAFNALSKVFWVQFYKIISLIVINFLKAREAAII